MTVDPLALRMSRRMLQVYQECDPVAERAAKEMHATCTKGCAACCRLLVTAPLAEAVTIAVHLFQRPDWQTFIPALIAKLEAQLDEYHPARLTAAAHFEKQLPCVFLGEDNLCQIYSVRPTVCRTHYAVSPPANCSHGAADSTVRSIDLRRLRVLAFEVEAHVQGKGRELAAPLPVMMFGVLMMLANEARTLAEYLEGLAGKPSLLNLGTWLGIEGA